MAWLLVGSASSSASAAEPNAHDIRPFLDTYCISCHGPEKQKGKRRFDALATDLAAAGAADLWQDIVDQLNLGEMPPPEEKQPATAEVRSVVQWATAALQTAHATRSDSGHGGQTVLRRLNRGEYSRTVRDLLALGPLLADPTVSFPPDATEDNFDNIGAALITSDFLLEKYLAAAHAFIEHAAPGGPKPESRKLTLQAPFCRIVPPHGGESIRGHYQNLSKSVSDAGGFLWLQHLPQGVPASGYYRIRVKAHAVNRNYPYDEEIIGTSKTEPLRLALVAGAASAGAMTLVTQTDRQLAEWDVAEAAPAWHEMRVWLDAGYQPRLAFVNGPRSPDKLRRPLLFAYPDHFPAFRKDFFDRYDFEHPDYQKVAKRPKGSRKFSLAEQHFAFYREYEGPVVRVHEIEIEGPLFDQWPAASHVALFGDFAPTLANAEPILRRFATRAFRRPATPDELAPFVALARARHTAGYAPLDALKAAAKAVLCSPNFLYLEEKESPLDDWALASRLSYFLWSTMPDEPLLALAAAGELRRPEILTAQTRRLLADSRAAAFTENFTARWLELYKLGTMPPSGPAFRRYQQDNLETAMRTETRLFFQHVLAENLPIDRFLDSDFTFVNPALARHYGLPPVTGSDFRKVTLGDARRGGLLGQASVLTVSANGVDTSPVVRGIWVMENILGTHPTPPPPDAKPLEPDIRGATTIREQLEKHRTVATCNDCHRKIDPLGFALESFDPIGRWRERYIIGRDADGPPVDPSGVLPDGQKYDDIVGFKRLLAGRSDQFARCLTEKLLAYATGRTMAAGDRPQVNRVVADTKAQGNGLQDLVLAVVQSETFRTK